MNSFEHSPDYFDDLSAFATDPAFDISSGAADEVLGSAAAIRDAAPEGSFPRRNHTTTVWFPPGELEGNETRYELECDICGHIGATKGKELAQVLARLHEKFVSVLVDLREAGERS